MSGIHIRGSRTSHPVVVTLAGVFLALPVVIAEQPAPKPGAKIPPSELREFLPALLLKASLENEREYLSALETGLKMWRVFWQAGEIGARELNVPEREALQARIRVTEQEASFLTSLHRLQVRLGAAHERFQKVDDAIRLPMVCQFKKFEEVFTDYRAARAELHKRGAQEEALKLRPFIRQLLTASALVQGTAFGKGIANRWASWEKLSIVELSPRLEKHRDELSKLKDKSADLESKGQALSAADQARLQEADLDVLLGRFERELRTYESQPWKGQRDPDRQHQLLFGSVEPAVAGLLNQGRRERLEQTRKSWPTLPSVPVGGVDLLVAETKSAEQHVAALLKKPEAAAAATGTLRELRALAEVYQLRQRLIDLSFTDVEITLYDLNTPLELVAQFPAALRLLHEAKGKLLHTWITFHLTRLNLYRDLELPPP